MPSGRQTRSASFSIRRFAAVVLGVFAAVLAGLLFVAHRVPLYGVETDLFGEFIPAARALLAGHPLAVHYEFKGPGYPLLLAGSTFAMFGDAWLAARLLNLVAAIAGVALTFMLVRRMVGDAAAAFVLVGLCVNPLYVRSTLEAGTDMPTFALCMAATYAALTARGVRGAGVAGLLAGLAILCRYNAAFLVPAGLFALVVSRDREAPAAPTIAAYLLGLALPLAPWLVLNHRMSGSAFGNSNYANLAFELYGGGMPWDRYWTEVAPRFRSYADVVRYDPGSALLHWLKNLGTRWMSDVRQLVPLWIGIPAVLGVLLHARRAWGRAGLLAHFALCYATLALVFYAPRFFLYLVPFYLAGAALAFFPRGPLRPARPARASHKPERPATWRIAAAGAAIVASTVIAVRETSALLRNAPTEVLAAGEVLRRIARPGDRVVARKPQVAYFAHMEYVPFPQVETVQQLLTEARRANARYLNLSGIEGSLRPQFRLLEHPEFRLPGFTVVGRDVSNPERYYVLYRIEPAGPADSAFGGAMLEALAGMAGAYPDNAQVQAYAGATFIDAGRLDVAIAFLDRALALEPGMAQARAYHAAALVEAGRLDEAARDCDLLIASLARVPASIHMLLGYIRSRQDRLPAAQAAFENAVRMEPASVPGQLVLGYTLVAQGKIEEGRAALDRAVRLAPRVAPLRDAALARAARGDVAGLEQMIEVTRRTVGATGSPEALVP